MQNQRQLGQCRALSLATIVCLVTACGGSGGGADGPPGPDDGGGNDGSEANTPELSVFPEDGFTPNGMPSSTSFPTKAFTLTNTGSLDLELLGYVGVEWLVIDEPYGLLPIGESVTVNLSIDTTVTSQMEPGQYVGSVEIIQWEIQEQVVGQIPVLLTLLPDAGPILTVNSNGPIAFEGPAGGPFQPLVHDVTLQNSGVGTLDWSLSSPTAWMGISQTSGSLGAGQSTNVQLFPQNTGGMADGTSLGGLLFLNNTSNGAGDSTLQGTLSIENPDQPDEPGLLSVGGSAGYSFEGPEGGPYTPGWTTFTMTNVGGQPINWNASTNAGWVDFDSTSGTLAPGQTANASVFPTSAADSLGAGNHAASITITSSEGQTFSYGVSANIGTTMEDDRFFTMNGQKFFPIYVWNQPPYESQIDYLDSLGITTYMNNGIANPENTNLQLLDWLQERGMNAFLEYDTNPAVINHPALLAWMLHDEPDLDTPPEPASSVQADYDLIRTIDTSRPVVMNLTGKFFGDSNHGASHSPAYYQSIIDIPEIISFDHYPVTGWNQPTWLYRPGQATEFMLENYTDYAKPCWAIIECSDQRLSWTPANTPGATPEQTRFMIWDTVIHGATAIGYFTIAFNPFDWSNLTPGMEVELARSNGQITAMTDIILSAEIDLGSSVSEPNGRTVNHTIREQNGVYYMFASNADMGYQSANPTFSFNQPISSVTVIDENRTITPNGNSFTDGFDEIEVHLYEIRF